MYTGKISQKKKNINRVILNVNETSNHNTNSKYNTFVKNIEHCFNPLNLKTLQTIVLQMDFKI